MKNQILFTIALFLFSSNSVLAQDPCDPVSNYGWTSQDIGSVAAIGSSCTDGVTFNVNGSGADIWDATDEFHFVYQQLTGDSEIIARVISMDNTDGWAKAGIMIRKSLQANSSLALLSMHPDPTGSGPRLSMQHRDLDGALMITSSNNYFDTAGSSFPIYIRLVRQGSLVSAYHSYTNGNWNLLISRSIDLNQDVFVGLAVTSHNDGVINSAYFDNVQLSDSSAAIPVTSVSLDVSSLALDIGQNAQLTATLQPSNATNQNLNWSSSNTSIATVNSSGLVTAVAEGNTTITVTTVDGGFTSATVVTVSDPGGSTPPGSSVWSETGSTASYSGDVAIGTATVPTGYRLAVEGHIRAREVRVDQDTWPDYVFKKGYDLPSLEAVQKHIEEHGHLPNIPSAKEVKVNGVELGEMDRLLLEKIEELTLYIMALKKENLKQQLEIESLKQE